MGEAANSNDRRTRVVQNLQDRSPKLAGVYATALHALDSDPQPGCESARVSVICHCMRELMLGLPPVLTDISIPRPKPSSGSLLSQLPGLLAKHPDLDLTADQDVVPVPRAVAVHVHTLVKTRTQEDGRNRSNTSALVTGRSDAEHPAIRQWREAYDFFLGWTHFDRNHEGDRELPTDLVISGFVRVIEDVVEVRTMAFFENLHSLEGLLSDINTKFDEDE